MKKFLIKTRAEFEQTYEIEANDEFEAKKIALENTHEFIEQTQVSNAEVLKITDLGISL